jgi:UDP-N-acetylmuramyl tripeptide synthase
MSVHRCDALEYSVAVFSNLTRDHLDYTRRWRITGTRSNAYLTADSARSLACPSSMLMTLWIELAERLEGEVCTSFVTQLNADAAITARMQSFHSMACDSIADTGGRTRISFAAGWPTPHLQYPGTLPAGWPWAMTSMSSPALLKSAPARRTFRACAA